MKELEDNLLYKLSATKGIVLSRYNQIMDSEEGFLISSFQQPHDDRC